MSPSLDLFDHEFKREVLRLLKDQLELSQVILSRLPQPLTARIAIRFTGESPMANALVFTVGQTSQASIVPLLADGITSSGGTLSNVVYNFSDPSATVSLNADGVTATCTAVAASTGAVAGTATCTVTDTDGVVSTWTQPFTITTNAAPPPPPQQLTQSVAVQFSTPTP